MNVNPSTGWDWYESLHDDGTFRAIREATPRAWAELLAACPELAGSLREIGDLLDQENAG